MSNNFGGTMQRPPSGFGRPPSGGGVPGTRGGPPMAGVGVGLNTQVEVKARPTQNQGMKMVTQSGRVGTSAGVGRQTQDRTYWIGLLRPKITELTQEIDRLKGVEQTISNNSSVLVQMQQRQKSLGEEIAKLKATMADVNFAVENSGNDVEAISGQAQQLKTGNVELRKNVDKLFLQVKEVENQTKSLQGQLDREMQQLDDRLRGDPRQYQEYRSARDELYRVSDALMGKQQELMTETRRQDALIASLSQDVDKKRAATIVVDIVKKRQLRDELGRECSVSVEEEREQLVRQAKTTAQDIDVLQRQLVEVKEAVVEGRNRVATVREDLNEYSGDNMRKYQELQEKDRETQEFIDTFKEKEREESERIKQVEATIQGILEFISRAEQLKATLPAENAPVVVDSMGSELGEKQQQLETAKITYQRLQKQLDEKKEELEKVADLDSRIQHDIQAMQSRMEEQQREIIRFSDLETLRREIDTRKRTLATMKTNFIKQRDAAKQQLHILSTKYEASRVKLNESDVHQSLSAQEAKLRLVWQGVFNLEDFVRTKEKECNYTGLKADCVRLCDEINGMLKDPKRAMEGAPQVGFQGQQW